VAAIANAIYFSDRWEREFNPAHTTERIFYAPSGEVYAYFMRREGSNQLYFEDENLQAIHLPFDAGAGMTIILPKSGDAVELLSSMTSESFDYILSNSTRREGLLLLPRFSIKNEHSSLAGALISLGVPLFDSIAAPLHELIYEELAWLTSAVQIAVIEVDEEGATAAAVTVMSLDILDFPEPQEQFEMICDSPFVFMLHSRTRDDGNQILFTGVVNQP